MEGKKHQDIAFSGGVSKLDPLYAFGGQRSNLKAVFNDLISINPDYFETPIAEIISHAEEKRWFELGESLVELFSAEITFSERENIFTNFIFQFAQFLSPKHLTDLIVLTSKDFSSPTKALDFIQKNAKTFSNSKFSAMLQLRAASLMTSNGLFEDSLKLLYEIEQKIDKNTPLSVLSEFWKTKCELDKARADYDSFYHDAFFFLSAANSKQNTIILAFDMCIAGLVAQHVYSFQELASHPVLDALVGTDNQWIRDLILLLNQGEKNSIKVFNNKYVEKIESCRQLAPFVDTIRDKVTISVFLTLVFKKPFDSRVLTFDEICESCSMKKEDVELFALKAFANDLIKGYIDQIDETIVVTWCKPRGLTMDRIRHLKDEIDHWCEIVSRIEEKESNHARLIL